MQDKKDYEEMLAMAEMREREYDIERVRNDLVILNRFYLRGGIVAAHPARVFYYQHDLHRYHLIGAATRQYLSNQQVRSADYLGMQSVTACNDTCIRGD